jgi:hypothetical protein
MPAKCWIAVNRASRCRVTELKELARECGNHIQVVEVVPPGGEPIIITNVYDQYEGSETNRPAQRAAWGEITRHRRVIIAGDMNAHSKMWNPRAVRNRNHIFWERLIEEEDLFVWNTEEATRMGPGARNHSVIDLTLSSPNIELNWCLLDEEATGSDHEVIAWEVLGNSHPRADTSTETTGWDISGWDPTKESKDAEKKKAEERKAKARECLSHPNYLGVDIRIRTGHLVKTEALHMVSGPHTETGQLALSGRSGLVDQLCSTGKIPGHVPA